MNSPCPTLYGEENTDRFLIKLDFLSRNLRQYYAKAYETGDFMASGSHRLLREEYTISFMSCVTVCMCEQVS